MITALQRVDCVGGCGSGEVSAITVIGLAVAIMGLALAVYAIKISNRSLGIAQEQHEEFLKQLRARADFELSIVLDQFPPSHVVESSAPKVQLKWNMGIENTGERAANDVGVNFLIPQDLVNFHWTSQIGGWIVGNPTQRLITTEELDDKVGAFYPAQYLTDTIDRLSLSTSQVCFAAATVEVPPAGEERIVPVKLKVWSDDLPDGVGSREVLHQTIVRRKP